MADISKKFKIFPTPKYLRIIKMKIPVETIIPRTVFAKIKEKVTKRQTDNKTKNRGNARKDEGFNKIITIRNKVQNIIVRTRVGKKFFLRFIFSLRLSVIRLIIQF